MRIRQLALVARDLERVVDDCCAVLGVEVAFHDPGVEVFGLRNAVMPVGDTFLEVVSPARAGTAAGRFLDRRGGPGGYMVILQTADLAADRRRLEMLGVRVVWEIAFPDIATVHLHPRDVGGAIVSLDQAEPPASWRWAGPDWQTKVRSDVTTAITGVELAAPDPVALAARWAAVLDRPVVADGDGTRAIALEGGRIRFVPAGGAAEAGVTAIDIGVADPARLVAAARARGVARTDADVTLGGVRVRLARPA